MSEPCIGCGAKIAKIDGPIHRYMTSAPGCWARYGELLGILSIEPRLQAARQMCVDAYAVTHPGRPNPQAIRSVAVHLLNLHDYLVRLRPVGVPRLLGRKRDFHWLHPPSFRSTRTVLDIPLSGSDDSIAPAARAWAESVWEAWSGHHAQIATWSAEQGTS